MMQSLHQIPLSLIADLRCGHCRRFVTCGPVHLTPDSSILCGRCRRFAKQTYRNVAYEAVASIYYFPCHYWGLHCPTRLRWDDSLDHERNCDFQSGCSVLCSHPATWCKSERKLPTNSTITFQHVTEEILNVLKCLSCESYLSNGPVYTTIDGKNICHRCCHSNGSPKNTVRNLAYEKIASTIIFPCIYRFRGCSIRIRFGREMWQHEHECPFGRVSQKVVKKPLKVGKERGVIETHSGHIWGTITPHSALFAPPKAKNNGDKKFVAQELAQVIRNKHKDDDVRTFDSQSMDSVGSTMDSQVSRSGGDNVSRDNNSRSSSRQAEHQGYPIEDYRPSISNHPRPSRQQRSPTSPNPGIYQEDYEVAPLPTPTGYQKVANNGYYQDNMARYGRPSNFDQYPPLYHFPPVFMDGNPNLNHSTSFTAPQNQPHPAMIKKVESFRVGNQQIINELRERNNRRVGKKDDNPYEKCNSFQDIVQLHDEVFIN